MLSSPSFEQAAAAAAAAADDVEDSLEMWITMLIQSKLKPGRFTPLIAISGSV